MFGPEQWIRICGQTNVRFLFEREPARVRYTNSQLKCLTERIRFFVLTKPSEVRRTGGTLNGTRQSQSEKDGARIKPF